MLDERAPLASPEFGIFFVEQQHGQGPEHLDFVSPVYSEIARALGFYARYFIVLVLNPKKMGQEMGTQTHRRALINLKGCQTVVRG
jgi:hypothetical protein